MKAPLATLPEEIAFDRLVDLGKLRWRIERDYQELKQEAPPLVYARRGFAHLSAAVRETGW